MHSILTLRSRYNRRYRPLRAFITSLLLTAGAVTLLLMAVIACWDGYGNDEQSAMAQPAVLATETATITKADVLASEKGIKVLSLNYHNVNNTFSPLSITPSDFDFQMKTLSDWGYHTISPDELYEALYNGGKLPSNPILITFDDGYADNYKVAFPILQKYGFKATVFVVTSFIGKDKRYLTWEQAREMADAGFSIESHTVSHQTMTGIKDETLRSELVASKEEIERQLGREVKYIAYPTGAYNLHTAHMVREAGYKAAFTIKSGNIDTGSNIYTLERTPVFHTENTNKDFFDNLRYQPLFTKNGWIIS